MNSGKGPDQLASEIQLPPEYADLPYLSEHYGCLEWTVRAIYTAYLGGLAEIPPNLHPMPPKKTFSKDDSFDGRHTGCFGCSKSAVREKDYQWCLELCDILLADEASAGKEVFQLKAAALEMTAEYETSANGRHYYIAYAKELREK